MTTVYGIPHCDTVKRSRAWFDEHRIAYTFHDFKKQGVPPLALDVWIAKLGWEALVNKKGTTWRKLDPKVQSAIVDAASARALMLREPSVIKRPVVAFGDSARVITVGFSPDAWSAQG